MNRSVVVKLGGSHLTRPDLLDAIDDWRRRQTGRQSRWWIVGGGQLVESLRQLDAIRPADARRVHWRAVLLLSVTFQTLADWFAADRRFADFTIAEHLGNDPGGLNDDSDFRGGDVLVNIASIYRPDCRWATSGPPNDWRTTTDSIAWAWAAHRRADRCVLLKSCDVDPAWSIDQLVERGIVDPAIAWLDGQARRRRCPMPTLMAQRLA